MFSGAVAAARNAVVAIGTVTAATAIALRVGAGVMAKALRVTLVAVTYSAAALVQLGSAWRRMRAAQRERRRVACWQRNSSPPFVSSWPYQPAAGAQHHRHGPVQQPGYDGTIV